MCECFYTLFLCVCLRARMQTNMFARGVCNRDVYFCLCVCDSSGGDAVMLCANRRCEHISTALLLANEQDIQVEVKVVV